MGKKHFNPRASVESARRARQDAARNRAARQRALAQRDEALDLNVRAFMAAVAPALRPPRRRPARTWTVEPASR